MAWIYCLYISNKFPKLSDKSKMEVNANIDHQILSWNIGNRSKKERLSIEKEKQKCGLNLD
jgi:hypothetical protein